MFSRDVQLANHLRYNFMPPVSNAIGCAKRAIDAVNAGDFDKEIETPSGKMMTASEICEQLRLEFFIEDKDSWE